MSEFHNSCSRILSQDRFCSLLKKLTQLIFKPFLGVDARCRCGWGGWEPWSHPDPAASRDEIHLPPVTHHSRHRWHHLCHHSHSGHTGQSRVKLGWIQILIAFIWLFDKVCNIWWIQNKCRDGIWTSTTRSSSSSSPMCGTPSKIYSWLSKHFSWWVFYIVKLITNSMKNEFVLLWISVRLCVFLSHTETSYLLSTMWCVRPNKPHIFYLIKDFI